MRKLKYIGLVVVVGVLAASSAFAAEFFKPADKNGTVTLPASETHRNVYAAGGNVIINSPITGDLYAGGGMVKVVGNIEDDLTLAGGNIDVSGKVGGNLRLAGGNISLSNTVQEDLLVAGGNIWIADTATVSGDAMIGAGNVELLAMINGSAKITGGTIVINNAINGELWVTAQEKLTFGPKAKVNGKITYYGNSEPVIQDGAQVGTIDKHPLPKNHVKRPFSAGLFGVGIIISLLANLAAALLLVYLLKREVATTTDMIRHEPWANLGIGLISMIAFPILFILLLVTVIGYYVAFVALIFFILALILSCLVGAIMLGRFIMSYVDKNNFEIDWRVVVVGVIAMAILKWIPLIGWLAVFLLVAASFGAIVRFTKNQLRKN